METGRVKKISGASVEGAMDVIVIVVNLSTALISYLITASEMNFVQILLTLLFLMTSHVSKILLCIVLRNVSLYLVRLLSYPNAELI